MRFLHVISKNISTFVILFILTRFLGKKQISQLTFFDYITGITIGSIAANMSNRSGDPFLDDLISLVLWVLLTYISSVVSLKYPKARTALDGEPTILIKKGKIEEDALSSLKLGIDELTMQLRNKDIFSITDVEYAILEPNGELSVLKKAEKRTPTKEDLNVQTKPSPYLLGEIITDGNLIEKNLKEFGADKRWLKDQLVANGIKTIEEVLYAEIQEDGTLFVEKKQQK